jgi:hypothetical protein
MKMSGQPHAPAVNPLPPNVKNMSCIYICRTAFVFLSSKCRLFHNATLFGSCIIHILNTGVLKFKRKFRRQSVTPLTILQEEDPRAGLEVSEPCAGIRTSDHAARTPVAYPEFFFGRVQKLQLTENSDRGGGGGNPLLRGSSQFANG